MNSYEILTNQQIRYYQNKANILIQPHLEYFSVTDFDKSADLIFSRQGSGDKKIKELNELKKFIRPNVKNEKSAWENFTSMFNKN